MKLSVLPIALLLCLAHPVVLAQTIQTVVGKGTMAYNGDGGPAIRASFYNPGALAWDQHTRTLYVADFFNSRIRRIDSNGYIRSLDSIVQYPFGLALDRNGDLYVSGSSVYKFPKAGGMTLIAGNGNSAYNGDGIPATTAAISPMGLAFDSVGNLYIADAGNNRIRKVDTSGKISTVAGTGVSGFNGDGIPANSAMLNRPVAVAFDRSGRLIISDSRNYRIRRVGLTGTISTIAGNGTVGNTGDNGLATSATINHEGDIVLDSVGNIYFGTAGFNTVRKVDIAGYIRNVAGTGVAGFSGDGGLPSAAVLHETRGLAISADQSLYVADMYNQRIRKICTPATVRTTCSIQVSHSNPGAWVDTLRFTTVFTPWAAGVIYKWRVNGGLVSTDSFFAYPWLSVGDTITVEVLAHDLCAPFFRDTAYVMPVDVPHIRQQLRVSVYPNPASGSVTIQTKDLPADCFVMLTDIQSRTLIRQTLAPNSRNVIDLSNIPGGTYFLNIDNPKGIHQTFVLQHY